MKTVLICDDSPIVHTLLTKSLTAHGYKICAQGYNGRDAVDLYSQHHPDIVLLDITMPIMDGLEALKAIREKDPQAKVVMLSAMGDEEIIAQAESYGASIFLKKPFNEYKVISALSSLV